MGAVVARGTRELVRGAGARARAPVPLSGAARPDALPRSFDRPRPVSVLGTRFRDARTRVVERAAERHRWCWERGGIAGIAMSHPHFYGAMVEWSRAFGNAPIYVPSADAEWVQYDDPAIVHWERAREVLPGVTLVQCGGHFEGSAVLHWAAGAEGRGALLVGDTITVVPDVRFVSFMRSYPNHIPLPAELVERIVAAVRPLRFDRIYGGWWDRVVSTDGPAAIERSARRYLPWTGPRDEVTAEAGRPN